MGDEEKTEVGSSGLAECRRSRERSHAGSEKESKAKATCRVGRGRVS